MIADGACPLSPFHPNMPLDILFLQYMPGSFYSKMVKEQINAAVKAADEERLKCFGLGTLNKVNHHITIHQNGINTWPPGTASVLTATTWLVG